MKTIIGLLLAACLCSWADESADRDAIERLIHTLSESHATDSRSAAALFAPDVDSDEFPEFLVLLKSMHRAAEGPWSEVTAPRILMKHLRWIAPDVALVDCTISQYGTVLSRHTDLLLVVKRLVVGWRIAAVRILR